MSFSVFMFYFFPFPCAQEFFTTARLHFSFLSTTITNQFTTRERVRPSGSIEASMVGGWRLTRRRVSLVHLLCMYVSVLRAVRYHAMFFWLCMANPPSRYIVSNMYSMWNHVQEMYELYGSDLPTHPERCSALCQLESMLLFCQGTCHLCATRGRSHAGL